jgi:hypothetical protein
MASKIAEITLSLMTAEKEAFEVLQDEVRVCD